MEVKQRQRLTAALKTKIVRTIATTNDFGEIAKLGVSIDLLKSWILRGTKSKSGIYRELRDELEPISRKAWRRHALDAHYSFFARLTEMAKRYPRFQKVLNVWYCATMASNKKIPEDQRLKWAECAREALGRRPIHHKRWQAMEKDLLEELNRLALMHGRTLEQELKAQTLGEIFIGADNADRLYEDGNVPDFLTQIMEEYDEIRRSVNGGLTQDVRRRKSMEEYHDDEATPHHGEIWELIWRRELREFVYNRIASLQKISVAEVKSLIEQHDPTNLTELENCLGAEHKALYREVFKPSRNFKSS